MGPDACQVYGRVSTPQPATATGAERNSEVDVQKSQHGAREGAHRQREEQSKSSRGVGSAASKKRSRHTAPADAGSHFFAPTVETCTPRQMDVSGVAYRRSLLPPTTPSRSAYHSHSIAPAGFTNDSTLVTARQTAIEGMSPPSERYREAGEQFVKRWLNL